MTAGDTVDVNGTPGIALEGEVTWPLDDTHIAIAIEVGPADTSRALNLARRRATTTVDH